MKRLLPMLQFSGQIAGGCGASRGPANGEALRCRCRDGAPACPHMRSLDHHLPQLPYGYRRKYAAKAKQASCLSLKCSDASVRSSDKPSGYGNSIACQVSQFRPNKFLDVRNPDSEEGLGGDWRLPTWQLSLLAVIVPVPKAPQLWSTNCRGLLSEPLPHGATPTGSIPATRELSSPCLLARTRVHRAPAPE